MNIERSQLQAAVDSGLVSNDQATQLWAFWEAQSKDRPAFTFTHVLYYLGGLIAIGGMSLYMTLAWEQLGGRQIFLIAAAYALVGLGLTHYLLERLKLPIPAGLTAAFVVAVTPLAVYGLQHWFGWWDGKAQQPYRAYHTLIDARWIIMELATLAVGSAMLLRYRLPFLLMPVAGTLWYMSMDLAPLLHSYLYPDLPANVWVSTSLWRLRQLVSVGFGLLVILVAILVDMRSDGKRDFAFWLYLAGVAAFWGGLSSMESGSEFGKIIYCLINVAMLFIGAALSRRVFAVFGALGIAFYLGHLSYRVFANSLMFPIALTLIGLGVILLGILWQRYEAQISRRLLRHLPASLRQLVEARAAGRPA